MATGGLFLKPPPVEPLQPRAEEISPPWKKPHY